MKRYVYIIFVMTILAGCHNQYLKDYYVLPQAIFTTDIDTDTIPTLQSVTFINQGKGQTFSVWPGDVGHVYGLQGNTGYTINSSGTYSYSYREPGTYTIVWVAGSVNAKGKVEQDVDSIQLVVVDMRGGLDELSIKKIYRLDDYDASHNTYFNAIAEQVNDTTLMCGVIYEAWREGTINSIKSPKMLLAYTLTSSTASLYWWNKSKSTWVNVRSEVDNVFGVMENGRIAPQRIKVVTASGYENHYWLYAVMMPKITTFSINGVEGTITHELTSYNVYDIDLILPAGTDVSSLKPEWQLMADDANLLDGATTHVMVNGIEQTSGTSVVDFSNGIVEYNLYYQPFASEQIYQTSVMRVSVTTE